MQGIAPTAFGNRVLLHAQKSASYARMQLGMFKREKLEHGPGTKYACKAGCAGCLELDRVIAALEQLVEVEEQPERYP